MFAFVVAVVCVVDDESTQKKDLSIWEFTIALEYLSVVAN